MRERERESSEREKCVFLGETKKNVVLAWHFLLLALGVRVLLLGSVSQDDGKAAEAHAVRDGRVLLLDIVGDGLRLADTHGHVRDPGP